MKKSRREVIEGLIIQAIDEGYTSRMQIAQRLKMAQSRVVTYVRVMIDERKLYASKFEQRVYYSTKAPETLRAHDPFGFCHAKNKRSNEQTQLSD